MRLKSLLVIVLILVLGVGLGIGATALIGHSSSAADICAQPPATAKNYQVIITNNKVNNSNVTARLCDTITFKNMDKVAREIAFGPHEHHVPYDGVAERVLNQGQSFTITLNQAGSFHWHDHIHDEVQGYFTVK